MKLTLVSRDSRLSRVQSRQAKQRLENLEAVETKLVTAESAGDRQPEKPLAQSKSPGFFTSELDRMVADGRVDVAVHSLKDCPTDLPGPVRIGALLPRTNYHDVLVGPRDKPLPDLGPGLTVGTGSARRKANLLYEEPELSVVSCRGNVPTRLEKLESPENPCDVLVLSEVGLERLGLEDYPTCRLSPGTMLPAPGQGAVALTCRNDADEVLELLVEINHKPTARVCAAERSFLAALDGGCRTPAGALGKIKNSSLRLRASLASPAGDDRLTGQESERLEQPRELGKRLAEQLLASGGRGWVTDAG